MFNIRHLLSAGALALTLAGGAQADTVVFDNISSALNSVPGATLTSTSSTPNTWMGGAFTLAAGTTSISGFDLYPVNLSGTAFTDLRVTIDVWGGVNTGTVNAASPAFSNLLGSFTKTFSGDFQTGFFYPIEGADASTPGFALASALAVPGTIGISINVQGSTDGSTFANANSLSSIITYGVPAAVGSNVFNGYYRNAAGEVNGNFTSAVRSLGFTNQSIGLAIYSSAAPVPEPATMLMMAFGVAGLLAVRRRQA
ncbi:MAG TPA: PEP-CTERM sorting domain-containing protein [Burkholderiaceae bacterium]